MGDVLLRYYPPRVYAADYIKSNHALPFWAPEIMGGYPLFADSETGMLYPLNALYLFLNAPTAYCASVVLHFVLAGVFMFLFVRHLTKSSCAALVAGIVFMFNGFMVAHLNHTSFINTVVWMPLVFYFFAKGLDNFKYFYFCGGALTLQALASHPVVLLLTALCLFFYAVACGVCCKKLRVFYGLGCAFLVSAGLSAVQTFPFLEFFALCDRSAGLSFKDASYFSLKPEQIRGLFIPFKPLRAQFFAEDALWEMCGYVGLIPLVLMLAALRVLRTKKEVLIFYVMLFLGVFVSLGKNFYLYPVLFQVVPLVRSFQSPPRFLLLFIFSGAVLAGAGYKVMDDFVRLHFQRRWIKYVLPCVSFILFLDLCMFGKDYNPTVSFSRFSQDPQAVQILKKDRSLFRVAVFPGDFIRELWRKNKAGILEDPLAFQQALLPNAYLLYHLHGIHGRHPFVLSAYKQYLGTLPNKNVLNLLNVKYVLSDGLHDEDFNEIFQFYPDLRLYENKAFMKRAFLAPHVRVVKTNHELLEVLKSPAFNPHEEVLLEENVVFKKSGNTSSKLSSAGNVRIVKYSNHEVVIKANVKKQCFLVLGDIYYPGWQVFVDGRKDKMYRAYSIFRAVALAEGEHRVTFFYRPGSVVAGAAVTFFTAVCLAGTLAYSFAASKRRGQRF